MQLNLTFPPRPNQMLRLTALSPLLVPKHRRYKLKLKLRPMLLDLLPRPKLKPLRLRQAQMQTSSILLPVRWRR